MIPADAPEPFRNAWIAVRVDGEWANMVALARKFEPADWEWLDTMVIVWEGIRERSQIARDGINLAAQLRDAQAKDKP